jgi:hypothetical protein
MWQFRDDETRYCDHKPDAEVHHCTPWN